MSADSDSRLKQTKEWWDAVYKRLDPWATWGNPHYPDKDILEGK